MTVRFEFNKLAPAELVRTEQMATFLREKAEAVASAARDLAPVLSGAYRDSIEATVGIEGKGLIGRVNANRFTAWWLEFGTVDTPAFHVLSRAAEAVGLRLSAGAGLLL